MCSSCAPLVLLLCSSCVALVLLLFSCGDSGGPQLLTQGCVSPRPLLCRPIQGHDGTRLCQRSSYTGAAQLDSCGGSGEPHPNLDNADSSGIQKELNASKNRFCPAVSGSSQAMPKMRGLATPGLTYIDFNKRYSGMNRFVNLELGGESEERRPQKKALVKDEAYYHAEARSAFENADFDLALRPCSKILELNSNLAEAWTGQSRIPLASARQAPRSSAPRPASSALTAVPPPQSRLRGVTRLLRTGSRGGLPVYGGPPRRRSTSSPGRSWLWPSLSALPGLGGERGLVRRRPWSQVASARSS